MPALDASRSGHRSRVSGMQVGVERGGNPGPDLNLEGVMTTKPAVASLSRRSPGVCHRRSCPAQPSEEERRHPPCAIQARHRLPRIAPPQAGQTGGREHRRTCWENRSGCPAGSLPM
jgi:hypothetical protein